MTRKEWYNSRFEPLMKKIHPQIHITFDIFTNKSRDKGFDHRTKNESLREKAAVIYAMENISRMSSNTENDRAVVDAFMDFIQTPGAIHPHKTLWARKFSKLDFIKIKDAVPQFTEFEFNLWVQRPDENDTPEIMDSRLDFRVAYENFLSENDQTMLTSWYERVNAPFTKVALSV